jgi:hypothetical protein
MAIGFFELIKYVGYIPQLAGVVMATVAFVEGVKAGDAGADKKAAVLSALESSWSSISANFSTPKTFAELAPLIGLLIDLAVAVYNIFWKKDVVTPA